MHRTLPFQLRNFNPVPASLSGRTSVQLYLRRLFHQMYLDHFHNVPPSPNPFFNLYQHQLTNSPLFEFRENGLGCNKEARIGESNKFGKALLRWFLSRYCGMTHYAHVDRVLGLQTSSIYRRVTLTRSDNGDLPDFVCANVNTNQVYLGEAKGRLTSFTFRNSNFQNWRDQFDRIEVTAANGRVISLKGYIVATQIRRRGISGNWTSRLYCEDPATPGEPPNDSESTPITSLVCELHYGEVLQKLGFPTEANALLESKTLQRGLRTTAGVWRVVDNAMKGNLFVGISLSSYHKDQFCPRPEISTANTENFWLSKSRTQPDFFFGLSLDIFRKVLAMAKSDPASRYPIRTEADLQYQSEASDLSYEGDGTLICDSNSVEFQRFLEL